MRIIEVNGNKYVDQDLFQYINNIWLTYDIEIEKDSNIYFAKNTTVNRLITDYCGKNISRVIKKEKADYVVINKFALSSYPQYYDEANNNIVKNDDTKEVVYGIYNNSLEIQDTIELILDFINRKQEVKYTNQDKLNDSLNNGFIIDKESYITIKELVDSGFTENQKLAVNMLVQSDLKANWEWILYLYHNKSEQFSYDKKNIITNYFNTLNLGYNRTSMFNQIDVAMKVIKNPDVLDRFKYMVRQRFINNSSEYLKSLGTTNFRLDDFKIEYNEQH